MRLRVRLWNFIPLIFLLSLSLLVDAQHSKRKKVARNPPPRLAKTHFISGNNALKIPFELTGNLILLQARLNDSVPSWFILDTGATDTVIDSQLAKTLRLKPLGRTVGTGGAGTATALIFKGTSLKLPNVEAMNLTLYGLPIDFLSAPLGRKISGVIGNDILKQMIVEVVSLDALTKPRRCQNQRARPVPRPDRADAWRTAHSEWAPPSEANSQGELDNSRAGAET